MSEILLVGAVAILLVLFGAFDALLWMRLTSTALRSHRRRRVLVTLKTNESFLGVLFESDREYLVLRDAEAIAFGPKSENVPVNGELLLARPDVAYLQVIDR